MACDDRNPRDFLAMNSADPGAPGGCAFQGLGGGYLGAAFAAGWTIIPVNRAGVRRLRPTGHLVEGEIVIYIALTFWLFLVLFAGTAVYRMLGRFGKARWVDWALLPGTIVSEMAYIFGCLITGAEIRHAKLISSESKTGTTTAPATEATPKLKVVGPIIAALVAIVACMAAIVIVHSLLGDPVIGQFAPALEQPLQTSHAMLPQALPTSWAGFWDSLRGQVDLLERTCTTWGGATWFNWRVPLFVYLAICLAIRLAPVSRPVRPTLGAAVVVSVLIALIGLVSANFQHVISDIWPLLTYVWASLLVVLTLVLLAHGAVYLTGVLSGKRAT